MISSSSDLDLSARDDMAATRIEIKVFHTRCPASAFDTMHIVILPVILIRTVRTVVVSDTRSNTHKST